MNPKILSRLAQLSDSELLKRVKQFAGRERLATADLIAHLAEMDRRRLYLSEGYSSLFAYCTQALQLSEHAAYGRIEAARIIGKFPIILKMLEQGSVNLTTVCLITDYLTDENFSKVLEQVRYRSKRQVEEVLARLYPQPPVPSSIRKLPTPSNIIPSGHPEPDLKSTLESTDQSQKVEMESSSSITLTSLPARPATIAPLAPDRYKVQFTASAETFEKLRLTQNLLRHQIPNGDPAAIFDRALTVLLEDLARKKLASTDHPRASRGSAPGSRHVPAHVMRAVWHRDAGRCAFVSSSGRRCTEEGFLEFHHATPYAVGGQSTVENVQLRCRAHNVYEAELAFGPQHDHQTRL